MYKYRLILQNTHVYLLGKEACMTKNETAACYYPFSPIFSLKCKNFLFLGIEAKKKRKDPSNLFYQYVFIPGALYIS